MSIKTGEHFVRINLPDAKLETDINKELMDYHIDEPFEINEAMRNQPILYLKWADLYRKAKKVQVAVERMYEEWYAEKLKSIREVLVRREGNHKPTKDDLKNGILRYYRNGTAKWNKKLDRASDNVNTLEMIVKATITKQQMLVSIGQLCSRLIDSGNMVVRDKRLSKKR